ncbi:MAG: hypothetical protein J0I82_18910, partial [Spirosoma sp.]|nr:hypothetical protein [Spirosoma sp.]
MPYDTYVTADSGDFTADQTNPVTYVTADSTDFTSDQINHDTYVTADSTDFTSDSIDPNPTPTVQIVVANPEYFNPVVEWSNGKARIVNTASFNSGGKNIYYFIGGQPYVANLPTSYVFSPGDSVSIIMAIGTSPDSPYNSHWSQKAYAQIIFGPEPTPSDPAIP